MSDKVKAECPFCGESFRGQIDRARAIHPQTDCHLSSMEFRLADWAMRPPKQEAPAPAVMSEVERLRQMVAALTLEDPKPNHTVEYISMPDGIYASREGTAK